MNRDDDLIRRGDVILKARYIPSLKKPMIEATAVEQIPAVPREMTAREFAKLMLRNERWCIKFTIPTAADAYVELVEQWAAEHPEKKRKTYAEDFKEKFKKAYETNGHPAGCREAIYNGNHCPHKFVSCEVCWNEEMEEEE